MWILHLIPDSFLIWIVNITCIVGLSATVLGFFLSWVPFVNRYKTPLQILGIILLTVGVYWKGGYSTEMEWRARVAEVEAKVKVAEAKAKKANAQVQTKIVTKIVKIHDKARVVKERIQQNKEVINRECKLSDEAISIYNSSITKEKK
jgi:apolipoprotein N-acyltransferase